jgi:hypothetical protein
VSSGASACGGHEPAAQVVTRPCKRLSVVHVDKRVLVGHFGEHAEHRQSDEKRSDGAPRCQSECDPESVAPRSRETVERSKKGDI